MHLRFWKYLLLASFIITGPAKAQIKIDFINVVFKGIPYTDSTLYIPFRQEIFGSFNNNYASNDSGYSEVMNDTVFRFDNIAKSYTEPDGTLIPEIYKQQIFFIIDSTVNRLRYFSLDYGFYDIAQGWYSHQTFTFDSIDIHRTGSYYHASMSGRELAQHGFYFFGERGNIKPNIPGWITRMQSCDSDGCGSVDIYFNGMIPLDVTQKKNGDTFFVRPNPAQDMVTISSTSSIGRIEIYDLLGRMVCSASPDRDDQSFNLNVSGIHPGMYWLRTGTKIQKLIIKR
jgi:hypothetical protein